MSNNLWQVLKVAPIVLGASVLAAGNAQAQSVAGQETAQAESQLIERLDNYSQEGNLNSQDQLTSVFQLRDVPTRPGQPGFWAFDALKNLVEKYGCIAGFPQEDGTFLFRGERNLTRYEFAAALNACLQKVELLIGTQGGDQVTREDLATLFRLQEEFNNQLAALGGRTDNLEVRIDELEDNQFSTTTKLDGEVIFAPFDTFGDRAQFDGVGNQFGSGDDDETETAFGGRVRLNFNTSFSGEDRLRVRLQFRNFEQLDAGDSAPGEGFTGTGSTRLGFDDVSGGGDNNIDLDDLWYQFPIGENSTVRIWAIDTELRGGPIETLSPFASSGSGALSRFARVNPVYRNESEGAGFAADIGLSDSIAFQFGVGADEDSADPDTGIFFGGYTAVAQVVVEPSDSFKFLIGYNRSFNPGGDDPDAADDIGDVLDDSDIAIFNDPGTFFANAPFGGNISTVENSVFATANIDLGEKVTLYGTFAASFLNAQEGSEDLGIGGPSPADDFVGAIDVSDGDSATALTGLGGIAIKDFGGEKNVLAILAGVQPFITSNDAQVLNGGVGGSSDGGGVVGGVLVDREDDDIPIHIEAYYRIQVTKNIRVTPGAFVIINPEGNSDNDTLVVGTIRTTFKF